jgi:hypothetical protein
MGYTKHSTERAYCVVVGFASNLSAACEMLEHSEFKKE